MGTKYKISSTVPYNSLLIWGLYGTRPVLTVVALNNNQAPGVIDLAEKELIKAALILDTVYEIEIGKDVSACIISAYKSSIELVPW